MEHKCDQVVHIKRMARILDGNGQLGLVKDVENLKNNFGDMKEELQHMSTSLAALAKSQIEQDAINKLKANNKERFGKALERASYAFGIAAIVVTWMVMFGGN